MNGAQTNFTLPSSVVSKKDLARLVNEFEQVDSERTAADVREKTGVAMQAEIPMSEQLNTFLSQNQLTVGNSLERSQLIKELRVLKETVLVIHMTFATPADRESLKRLVQWVRASIHPQAVIEVGLQPALVAGVSVRTPNRIHDFSMRAMLKKNHGMLVKELGALHGNG